MLGGELFRLELVDPPAGVCEFEAFHVGGGIGVESGFGLEPFVGMNESFGFGESGGGEFAELVGESFGGGGKFTVGDESMDESPLEGLLGGDLFTGDAHFHRAGFADQGGELGDPVAGGPAEEDFGHPEPGFVGGDPEVAGGGGDAAPPEGSAGDGGDEDLRELFPGEVEACLAIAKLLRFDQRQGADFGDVITGAEVVAGAGHDHDAEFGVIREEGVEPFPVFGHLAIDGVPLERSIEEDVGDRAVERDLEGWRRGEGEFSVGGGMVRRGRERGFGAVHGDGVCRAVGVGLIAGDAGNGAESEFGFVFDPFGESFELDDGAAVFASADDFVAVMSNDVKVDGAAIDGQDGCDGADFGTQGCRGEVIDLDAGADRRFARFEERFDRLAGGAFHQQDHARGREDGGGDIGVDADVVLSWDEFDRGVAEVHGVFGPDPPDQVGLGTDVQTRTHVK